MTRKEILKLIENREVIQSGANSGSRLVVLVHGWLSSASVFASLIEAMIADNAFANCDYLAIEYGPQATRFSNADPVRIAREIKDEIRLHAQLNHYESFVLSGWSIGGVILREAILQDIDDLEGEGFSSKVERLVLLASTNRGFIPSRWWERLLTPLIRMTPLCGLIKTGLRESPFILNLRLRWIREFEGNYGMRAPDTVQVLGSEDKIVSQDDSADIYRYGNSASVGVPGKDHFNLIEITDPSSLHYKALRTAFVDELAILQKHETESPQHFVFLVHGIRDFGGWTKEVGRQLDDLSEIPGRLIHYPFRYGYFNILNFILPFVRRRQARRFVDRYANAFARHPSSTFHFVGHSNGTFLLGEALKVYPGVRFDSVFLAGSVLSEEYDWLEIFDQGRVNRLRNDCASEDVPVGFLCGFLGFFFNDLGVGGFRGFQKLPSASFHENQWISGGHGDALKGTARARDIAEWVLNDKRTANEPIKPGPPGWLDCLSRFALPAGMVAIALLVGVGFLLWPHSFFLVYITALLLILCYL